MRRVLSPIGHVCTFSGSGERFTSTPWGIFGGRPGRSGRFVRVDPDGTEMELPSKPAGVEFGPGQTIAIETPGAGGYGDPRDREAALIERDLRSEKFSRAYIERHYSQG